MQNLKRKKQLKSRRSVIFCKSIQMLNCACMAVDLLAYFFLKRDAVMKEGSKDVIC
ncbi:hypothetical protein HUJ05_012721 [Dendroctonus ponderosae]|nr:hypothetical protein HUJ05_012721 [Dendroctonus ponderosae]